MDRQVYQPTYEREDPAKDRLKYNPVFLRDKHGIFKITEIFHFCFQIILTICAFISVGSHFAFRDSGSGGWINFTLSLSLIISLFFFFGYLFNLIPFLPGPWAVILLPLRTVTPQALPMAVVRVVVIVNLKMVVNISLPSLRAVVGSLDQYYFLFQGLDLGFFGHLWRPRRESPLAASSTLPYLSFCLLFIADFVCQCLLAFLILISMIVAAAFSPYSNAAIAAAVITERHANVSQGKVLSDFASRWRHNVTLSPFGGNVKCNAFMKLVTPWVSKPVWKIHFATGQAVTAVADEAQRVASTFHASACSTDACFNKLPLFFSSQQVFCAFLSFCYLIETLMRFSVKREGDRMVIATHGVFRSSASGGADFQRAPTDPATDGYGMP
ncbi:unnamed protein product [Hydatigera taeniaeformis]|uniref:MARVEL domain-containing protein n=1 Tax=Hydatigena taeniaeformis TaxID=6205 RepID=A0A0R3X305_HYDTA|nr:unnamed protein product [Hydatigera taeniaeformis]